MQVRKGRFVKMWDLYCLKISKMLKNPKKQEKIQ